jgi:hypothetical protein
VNTASAFGTTGIRSLAGRKALMDDWKWHKSPVEPENNARDHDDPEGGKMCWQPVNGKETTRQPNKRDC